MPPENGFGADLTPVSGSDTPADTRKTGQPRPNNGCVRPIRISALTVQTPIYVMRGGDVRGHGGW